jgi:hypothetical protein
MHDLFYTIALVYSIFLGMMWCFSQKVVYILNHSVLCFTVFQSNLCQMMITFI